MVTDKSICDKNGNLLLAKRTKLTSNHIRRIKKLDTLGFHINSHLSKDPEAEEKIKKGDGKVFKFHIK